MNKILIITTKGCEACEIAKHNIEIAVMQASANITIQTEDWQNVSKDLISKNRINDFPTVLYLIDKNVINKAVGSYPSAVYLRWIDMYFKK